MHDKLVDMTVDRIMKLNAKIDLTTKREMLAAVKIRSANMLAYAEEVLIQEMMSQAWKNGQTFFIHDVPDVNEEILKKLEVKLAALVA